ncbi:peptidase [Paracoccus yeei]|mgnify:FL=1|uniref:Peptidase n=2 Tax=Paracoccus TaxID=265 RepID=A0A386UJR6_9RHOB|nr:MULTISPECIES: PepSY domain-containing protein [Paracoccus]AWX94223.1 peptidase [Paracoccus mutanolyticus]AYF00771.1 peptidase [Paracoccus yeei]QEU08534.1 peptidase [Paracoccus yeei]
MTRALFLFLALLLAPQVAGGQGSPGPAAGPGPDVELARDLVERGEILPLAQVLARLQEQHPGKVIEVELEYSNGILVYEVDLVTTDGRLIEVDMNAANGTIVDVDEEED